MQVVGNQTKSTQDLQIAQTNQRKEKWAMHYQPPFYFSLDKNNFKIGRYVVQGVLEQCGFKQSGFTIARLFFWSQNIDVKVKLVRFLAIARFRTIRGPPVWQMNRCTTTYLHSWQVSLFDRKFQVCILISCLNEPYIFDMSCVII